jgi:transposase InsO family protein
VFRKARYAANVIQSFSAKGHPYDNAAAESFFKFLKREETDRRACHGFEELDVSLFEYARFYNNSPPRSFKGANGALTPNEREFLFAR